MASCSARFRSASSALFLLGTAQLCRLLSRCGLRLLAGTFRFPRGVFALPLLSFCRVEDCPTTLLCLVTLFLLGHALPVHLLVGVEFLHQFLPRFVRQDEGLRGERYGSIRHVRGRCTGKSAPDIQGERGGTLDTPEQ